MKTDDLIKALNADTGRKAMPQRSLWWLMVAIAATIAGTVFFSMLGPRHDIADVMGSYRFLSKFLFTAALAASAFGLIRPLSVPGEKTQGKEPWLLLAPALVACAIAIELFVVPSAEWEPRMMGTNSYLCMTFIPLIGIGPLAVFLWTLRHGASTRPAFAGAVAGMLAGGIAATFYAAHCFDDSPLFVAVWYTIAIAILTALGALGGKLFARW